MPLLLRYLAGFLPALALVSAAATPPGWTLRAWLSEDGLPNNYVTGLAQTPDGYLWAAMPSGLARFDGVRFESFPTGSFAQQFRHLRIRTLLGNPGLGLCVGVDPGDVVWLNRGTEEIVSNGLPRAMLETVVVDGNGALWVAYHGGSVYRIKDGVATPFGPDKGLPRGTASCALACDSQGRVWYSKGYETGIFSQGRFKPLVVLDNSETRLAAARDGGMWLCAGFRLYKYVEGGKPQDCGTLPGATAHSRVTVMLEDHTGAVWIGTSANGLFRYDGSHFESVPTSDREILALLEDREGNIWAGTGGGGLNLIRPRLIVWESAETGTRFGAVQSLCEDPVATIWGATSDGTVVRHVNGAWQPVLTNSEYASVMANCVAAGSNGNIWIGSRQGELLRLHGGQIAVFGQDDGLESREIHGLLPGAKGGVWICGQAPDSVQYLQGGIFHNIPIPPGAHHLWTLAGDGDGNIWVGGRGVLLRISKGRLKDESALMAGFVKDIRCLRAFQDGSLWMGFSGGGAGRLKNGKFTRIGVAQGLYATAINQIIEDGCGSVWFGSDGGIFRVREKELNAVADGRASSLWSVHYGRSEGIPSVQARYGDTPGALRSRDGRIWMPMRNGLAIAYPANLHEDLRPPPVLVNRVTVDDQTVALYGGDMPVGRLMDLGRLVSHLQLWPGFYRLEFEFTALSFGPSENIHFQYQLEGFDNQWRNADTLRSAIYSRLPAGRYRFKVKGCNGDGIWNTQGTVLAFAVEPFFWQSLWFRLAAIFGFTIVVVAIVRYVSFRRLRLKLRALEQQTALDRERARIARDIHDDLGGSLTQIALLSGMAMDRMNGKTGEHVRQISATTHQVIRSLDEIVWAVNPRNDTLPDVIAYLGQFAMDFLRTAGIQCRAELPDHPPRRPVTSETRHNLYLVVKEALNNIVRHAQADQARFAVNITETSAIIVIEDNGKGCANAGDAFADGLRNMRQRMEEIGGQFQMESAPGKGTRVLLIFLQNGK